MYTVYFSFSKLAYLVSDLLLTIQCETPCLNIDCSKFSFENKSAVANPADTLDFGYQTSDVDLRAIVESISAETGHESDEEFSLSSTLVQPSSVSRREAVEGDVASPDTKSSKICRASDEYQGHFSGETRHF